MGNIRRRLDRLEARTPPPAPVRTGASLDEIRALEERIRRLDAEIVAEGGTVSLEPRLEPTGVSLADLEALEIEIERLKLMKEGDCGQDS